MVLRDTSVRTKLYSNGLCLRKFTRMQSGRPEDNVQHFFEKPVEDTAVGVVVPIYNEQAIDLRKTLLSIDMQVNYMKAQKMFIVPHIMLVQDGVSKASPSMKKYLRNMFNLDEEQWKREFETEDNSAPYQTFILQRLENSHVTTVNINAGYKVNTPVNMLVTLIIKKDNRKKHNSHEWFLGESGFVNYYRPKYSLCTDCATLFHKACLMKLVQYMDSHPDCSVSTGRQRVMTREMQGDDDESEFSIGAMLRHAQRFDYESSFVCYTGTFSAVGFLPVVPGPCGLYRTESLIPGKDKGGYPGSPCEWYFDVVNTDPDKSGMVLGNLRIAEDRVLSYAVVLKAKSPSVMGLVPQAVFYFEAETKLKSLMLQRRRWINGTWAGYWYLAIQHPGLIFKCTQINLFQKIFVWFLLLCQLLTYFIVALAPAIFLGALRLSLKNLSVNTDAWLAIAVWLVLVLMYLYFVYYHHKEVYLGYLFNIWMFFSCVLSITSITSFIVYVIRNYHLLYYTNLKSHDFSSDTFTASMTIYIVIGMLVVPLIIAIIADGHKSIVLMLRSIVPYYMLLPMVVGFFSAYSFARCWDLTWGNRPSEADPAHQHNAKAKVEELKTQSATLTAFICLANIFFFFLQDLILQYNSGKLYIALVIFATAIIQMAIGFVWFTWWRITYSFRRLWFFMTHCRGMKKFTYNDYGHEEEEGVDTSDIYTLVYDEENDGDVANINDLIDENDPAEDYYDADADAIVLVDGDINRHMSVTNMNIYTSQQQAGGPSLQREPADGASPPSSPKMPLTFSNTHASHALHASALQSLQSLQSLQASNLHASNLHNSQLTRSALRGSNSNMTSSNLKRNMRTARANSIIDPNRVPIVASPAAQPPSLKNSRNITNPNLANSSMTNLNLNSSRTLNASGLHHRGGTSSPGLRNAASLNNSIGEDNEPPITISRRGSVNPSPVVDNRRSLAYSHTSVSSNVSFANPPAVILSNNNNNQQNQNQPNKNQ